MSLIFYLWIKRDTDFNFMVRDGDLKVDDTIKTSLASDKISKVKIVIIKNLYKREVIFSFFT